MRRRGILLELSTRTAVKPMSGKSIEELVEDFREMFGLTDVVIFPVLKFLELALPQIEIDTEIVEDWELPDAYAITDTGKGIIKIRNSVYEGAYRGVARDKFTICHEIGHAVLHTPDRVEFARGSIPKYMQSEWQANRFAAALLAPRNLALGMMPVQMSNTFQISMDAANFRYQDLCKLNV